jgi:hypothetical protein
MNKTLSSFLVWIIVLLFGFGSIYSQITQDISIFNARLDKENKVEELCKLKPNVANGYRKYLILELLSSDPKCFQNTTSMYNCIVLDTVHYQIALLDQDDKLYGSIAYNEQVHSYDIVLNSEGGKRKFVASPQAPNNDISPQFIANRAVAIRNILRLKPDAIMAYNQLANTFLFLKYDRIFVYRIDSFESIELDSYVRLILKGNSNTAK